MLESQFSHLDAFAKVNTKAKAPGSTSSTISRKAVAHLQGERPLALEVSPSHVLEIAFNKNLAGAAGPGPRAKMAGILMGLVVQEVHSVNKRLTSGQSALAIGFPEYEHEEVYGEGGVLLFCKRTMGYRAQVFGPAETLKNFWENLGPRLTSRLQSMPMSGAGPRYQVTRSIEPLDEENVVGFVAYRRDRRAEKCFSLPKVKARQDRFVRHLEKSIAAGRITQPIDPELLNERMSRERRKYLDLTAHKTGTPYIYLTSQSRKVTRFPLYVRRATARNEKLTVNSYGLTVSGGVPVVG